MTPPPTHTHTQPLHPLPTNPEDLIISILSYIYSKSLRVVRVERVESNFRSMCPLFQTRWSAPWARSSVTTSCVSRPPGCAMETMTAGTAGMRGTAVSHVTCHTLTSLIKEIAEYPATWRQVIFIHIVTTQ